MTIEVAVRTQLIISVAKLEGKIILDVARLLGELGKADEGIFLVVVIVLAFVRLNGLVLHELLESELQLIVEVEANDVLTIFMLKVLGDLPKVFTMDKVLF